MDGSAEIGGRVRIGRFSFEPPPGTVVSGRGQSIYRIELETLVATQELSVEAQWRGRVEAWDPQDVVRAWELRPGVPAVWRRWNPDDPELLSLTVLIPAEDHAVVAERGCQAGREADVERMLDMLVDVYRPGGTSGFCIGRGAIVSEEGQNEEARVVLRQTQAGVNLEFQTDVVLRPADTSPPDDLAEIADAVAAARGEIVVTADRTREAAGLGGREAFVTLSLPGQEPQVRASWRFPGEPLSSTRPEITVIATAPLARKRELAGVWNGVLMSLRQTPTAAPG